LKAEAVALLLSVAVKVLVPIVIFILFPVGLALMFSLIFSVSEWLGADVSFLQEAQLAEMSTSEKIIINENFMIVKL
jgi:hypothetical protein